MTEWIQANVEFLVRWAHVVAGVIWIGHLYFFNFVNSHLARTYDSDTKEKVIPELMPRALYWFRWGAMYTWITGILLLAFVYYMPRIIAKSDSISSGLVDGVSMGIILFIFFLYDALWKLVKNQSVATVVSLILVAALMFGLSKIFSGRALLIHLGAFFGSIMFLNVWMRIWPAQKKIIAGIKGTGPAADPSLAALAGLRSRHNTYMSVPLIFLMISNHYPGFYGSDNAWLIATIVVVVGWIITWMLFNKSESSATLSIGDSSAKSE